MKILFICGSLERGRDGVGDYILRLSGELIRRGHQVAAVALNDTHINETVEICENVDQFLLPILRVSSIWKVQKRFSYAKKWINIFNPHLLSLQFVPFAFDSKGLPFKLAKRLNDLGKCRSWHIMFHELWVGMEREAKFKHVLWGKLQQVLINSIYISLEPVEVHTHTKLYQLLLLKIGIVANHLPLFSNIPLMSCKYPNHFNLHSADDKNNNIIIIVFGGIHQGAPVEDLAKEAAKYARMKNVNIILRMIGRNGKEQDHWANVWKGSGLPVEILGEQPPEIISKELLKAFIGIATTPFTLIEKSGSVAAMIEHGLPILCVSKKWNIKGINEIGEYNGILEYKTGNFEQIFNFKKKDSETINVAFVASKFLHNLLSTESDGKS